MFSQISRTLFAILITATMFIAPAWAAQEPVALKGVVVTASRQQEKIAGVPADVNVLTRQDIQKSTAKSVPELLSTLAGLHVSDLTGNGRSYSVDFRGFGESAPANSLVLVDGRRTNQADLSGVDWSQIPLERIDRIEVVRGGRGSVLYGDNATSGVINIITREGRKTEAEATVKYGSYETFKANASASGVAGSLAYSVFGSYLDADGYRDNSQTEATDAGLNLRLDPSERISLNLTAGYHDDETGLPGALKDSDFAAGADLTDTVHPKDFSETDDRYAQLGGEIYFLSDSLFRVNVSARQRETVNYASFTGGFFEGETTIDTVSVSPQLIFEEKIGSFSNRLIMGLDYTQAEEDIDNFSEFFGTPSQGIYTLEKENTGYYVHDEFRPQKALSLSAGYRHDEATFSFSPASPGEKDLSEDLATAGINYQYASGSNVYASYARSFRYPLLDEIFNFFTNTIDQNLTAQTSDDFEIGVRHQVNENLSLNANLFHITTDDEIFYNPTVFSNQNMDGETRRQGFTLSATQRMDKLELSAAYAYTDAKIEEGTFEGSRVPNVPRHLAHAAIGYRFDCGLFFQLSGNYVGERYLISDFNNSFEQQEDYLLLNAKIRYSWQMVSLSLDVNNLTDEDYASYGGLTGFPVERGIYPSPGINVLFGVTVHYP